MESLIEYLPPNDAVSFYSTSRQMYLLSRQVYVSNYCAKMIEDLVPIKRRSCVTVADPLRTYNRLCESVDIELHACYGNVDEVRVLLESRHTKASVVQMALFRACEMGHTEIVDLIAVKPYINPGKYLASYQSSFSRKSNKRQARYRNRPLPVHCDERHAIQAALANNHELIARRLGWRPPDVVETKNDEHEYLPWSILLFLLVVGLVSWSPFLLILYYLF